jgi:glycosyltransferase involved in cell wall biosynthesis
MSTLSIVIPAYNEEKAIGAIVERCLAAREHIKAAAGLDDVEIIVVNDGSRDRTAEIAKQHAGIRLISHEINRGYGAALKTGFDAARGDVLGFLDADGTCDPIFFKELHRALEQHHADIAIGSRLNADSKMPTTRLFGNALYALLLGALSSRAVTDTASGMRLIRRSSLGKIYPLPDGMDFTPAMSAKALLDDDLSIVETPMPYHERVGASKLRVLSDGVRFLKSIVDAALMYKPWRVYGFTAMPLIAFAVLFSVYPVEFYIRNRMLEEWMIYRLITVLMCYLVAAILLSAAVLSARIVAVLAGPPRASGFVLGLVSRFMTPKAFRRLGLGLLAIAVVLNYEAARQYLSTGHIYVHWSRVLVGGFLVSASAHLFVTAVMMRMTEIFMKNPQRLSQSLPAAAPITGTAVPARSAAGAVPKPAMHA